jgi:hypothetical protein
MRLIAIAMLVALTASPLLAGRRVVEVADDAQLKAALADAKPGDTIRLTGTEYHRIYCKGLTGEKDNPITIESATSQPATFIGGDGSCVQFSKPSYLSICNIVIRGSQDNGLNIDDGGTITEPAHDIILANVKVLDTGPKGNHDGIKLSGVNIFVLAGCTVSGWGGSAIDMVGCHDGTILDSTFRGKEGFSQDSGLQMKGGSQRIRVVRCRFENAGERAVNIGGHTDLAVFRPPASQSDAYESKDIIIEGSQFIGSEAPLAFVGSAGALVQNNTFYRPGKWIMRILQESQPPRFVLCRDGRFEHNVVVFNKADMPAAVNIGEKTAPETFTFKHNVWFCMDDPAASKPDLPAKETDSLYGQDPKLKDPAKGDLTITNPDIRVKAGSSRCRDL